MSFAIGPGASSCRPRSASGSRRPSPTSCAPAFCRSPDSRYRQLSEDAFADLKLMAPFAARASRVMAADRVRLGSLSYVRNVDEEQIDQAIARVAENRCLVAWVRYETYGRLVAYRY